MLTNYCTPRCLVSAASTGAQARLLMPRTDWRASILFPALANASTRSPRKCSVKWWLKKEAFPQSDNQTLKSDLCLSFQFETTNLRTSLSASITAFRSLNSVKTSADKSPERHSENFRFSIAWMLGIGVTLSGSISLIRAAIWSSDVTFGNASDRLSPFTSQCGFNASASSVLAMPPAKVHQRSSPLG